jgi:TP901 family phage tail tape measure protein
MVQEKAKLDVLLELQDKMSARLRSIDANLKRFNSTTSKTGGAVNLVNKAFSRLAKIFTAGLIIRGIKGIADAAIEFEDAFAGVRKTVDATEEEFQQLSDGLIEISKRTPTAVTELARIQELAGQLGVRGVDNLTKFTETIAKISVTTNLTSESAATAFARIANIMQTPISEVDRMGASVVELGNNFATTEAEIVEFANRIAGAGKVVGLSEADIFAFGTAFTSVGVRAERGGTAVNKALLKISDAVEDGGKELEEFANIAGLTVQEFSRSFREDAGRTFALFIEGLGESGKKGSRILKDLELSDQRLIQAFLSVGGAGGILTSAINSANLAYEKNIALTEEAAKKFGTTAQQINTTKNNINALKIELGVRFLPVLEDILTSTTFVANALERAFGSEKVSGLKQSLLDRLELVNKNLKVQRLIINSAIVGNKNREDAERRINGLLEIRRRVLLTLADLENEFKGLSFVGKGAFPEAPFIKPPQPKKFEEGDSTDAESTIDRIKSLISNMFTEGTTENDKFFDGISNGLAGVAVQVSSFAEFWNSLWRSMAFTIIEVVIKDALKQLIKELITVKTLMSSIGGFFGGIGGFFGGLFHQGGTVKAHKGMPIRAHSGLATDEVPIIAQTGEGILSRRGMAALGGAGALNALNSGQGVSGGINVNITVNNPKMSTQKEVGTLSRLLGSEIERELRYARG